MLFNKSVSGALLIAGTTIGAGMLGIPLLTAKAGLLPAFFITTVVWLFMLATGLLFLEATLWMPEGANVLSLSRRFLGRGGKWVAGGTFVFLYYCLMVAYYAAGAPLFVEVIEKLFGLAPSGAFGYLSFGLLFGGIVAFGIKVVDRINYIFMVAMLLSYFLLVGAGTTAISWERFEYIEWKGVLFAAPILFSAFGYHNVIPSLVTYFDRNVRVLRRSILWGTFLPFAVYLIWQGLILGAVPLSAIESALAKGMPATQALGSLSGYPWVVQLGQFFAFFAIITSMLGVAFSMVDFLGDGLKIKRTGGPRILLCLLVFLPPFILSTLDPTIFVLAISFAGGFGEALLNGLLPIALVWVGRYGRRLEGRQMLFGNRPMLLLLFAFGVFVMVLEAIFVFILK